LSHGVGVVVVFRGIFDGDLTRRRGLAIDHRGAAWKDDGQGQQGSKDGLLHATLLGDAGIRKKQKSEIILIKWDASRKTLTGAKRFDPSPNGSISLRKTRVFPMSCGRIIETVVASDK
jgi:hypothetical protein